MAFGKELVYQQAYSVGTNNNRYFAEDINELIMAMQGNYVVSGCGVGVGAETNLGVSGNHLAVASGTAFVNGAVRTIGSTNIDLNTAFSALSVGEARFILVYINSSGSVATKSGDIVTDGNQLPEVSSTGWTGDDTTPLAWIYLTASDSTMDANQIFNQIVYAPSGGYLNGLLEMGGNIDLNGNDISGAGTITFDNIGAGSDPSLTSNSALQRLTLTGNLNATQGIIVGDDIALSGNNLTGVFDITGQSASRVVVAGGTATNDGFNIIYNQAGSGRIRTGATDILDYGFTTASTWTFGANVDIHDMSFVESTTTTTDDTDELTTTKTYLALEATGTTPRIKSDTIYNATTTSAANVHVLSTTGSLSRSTASSRRYKENIQDIEVDSSTIYQLQLRSFDYIESEGGFKDQIGYIAEELADIKERYAEWVDYPKLGKVPENISLKHIVFDLVDAIQKLEKRVKILEN